MSEELKPCPFCGGEARIETEFRRGRAIECSSCGANVGAVDLERGFDMWNRRATPPAPVEGQALPPLKPIDYDRDMDRTYIPLPGGWEIQTKGKGSSFRLAHIGSRTRWIVMDDNLHEPLEAMARDVRQAIEADRRARLTLNEGDLAAVWDSALYEAATYVEAHCVDGEQHANAIARQARPNFSVVAQLAQAQQVEQRWVGVDDARKPQERTPILVFVRTLTRGEDDDGRPYEVEGEQVEMGEYRYNNGAPYFQCFISPMSDSDWITHWMPLPSAPKVAP